MSDRVSDPILPDTDAQSPDCQVAVTISRARWMKVAGMAESMAEMTMHTTTIGRRWG